MMTQVTQFTPKKELSANLNLRALVTFSQKQLVLWSDQPGFVWENHTWPTTNKALRFLNHESRGLHRSKVPEPHQLMHPSFADLAKAYLRYRHTISPHRNMGREIQALRALEFALRQDQEVPDITKITQHHYDNAVLALDEHKGRAFICRELLQILNTLSDFFIVSEKVRYWKHPHVKTASYAFNNGEHASAEVKSAKLPNQDALLAIAEVFGRGHTTTLSDVDIMITSITCLMLSAPMRIGEILRFRVNCLDQDTDRDGKVQYYLKYWVPKINAFARKPIPEAMANNVVEAIERLKRITDKGRRLASYMEGKPTKFYRHENCPNVSDDMFLTRDQVAQALGFVNRKSCEDFIRKHTGRRALTGFTLNSLWQIVLVEHSQLNPNFPYQEQSTEGTAPRLKMSESLMCTCRYQFGTRAMTSPILLVPFNKDHFSKRLDGSVKADRSNARPLCFFTRHGYEAVKLKSHSFRHLLNRLARRSGVSIETITAWSSRASSLQTLTYLNDDPKEVADKASSLFQMHQEETTKSPIFDDEADLHSQGPFHRSRYGLCRRSWRAGPCNRFADCLNCSELLMCKGDKLAARTVKLDLEYLTRTYSAAQTAIEKGERSATRWTEVTGRQIERLTQLQATLVNPSIPDGSPIEIAGVDFSHERVLIDTKRDAVGIKLLDREDLKLEYGSELIACLDLLKDPDDV